MAKTQANFRIENDIKAEAERVLRDLGVTPSQAVNHLYRYVAEQGRLPFTVETTVKVQSADDVALRFLEKVERCVVYLRYCDLCEGQDKRVKHALEQAVLSATGAVIVLKHHGELMKQWAHSRFDRTTRYVNSSPEDFIESLGDSLEAVTLLSPDEDVFTSMASNFMLNLHFKALAIRESHPVASLSDGPGLPESAPAVFLKFGL